MATYGTIATSPSSLGPNLEYISRPHQRPTLGLATWRPWKEMLNHRSFVPPSTLEEAIGRLRTNLDYFLTNYAVAVLFVLFLGLLWHPLSLIVLTATTAAWLFLYFLRDKQLVILDHMIDGRVVLAALSVLTAVFLLLTGATMNVLISLSVGLVLVPSHAIFRKIDDLFVDKEAHNAGTNFL